MYKHVFTFITDTKKVKTVTDGKIAGNWNSTEDIQITKKNWYPLNNQWPLIHLIYIYCRIGYNDFELFDKREPPRPEMDAG